MSDAAPPTNRLLRTALLVAALLAWWIGRSVVVPWAQRAIGWDALVVDADLRVLFGHWFAWQLPGVVLCVAVWLAGARFGLLPSFVASFGSGGSWRRVVVTGLSATALLLAITVGLGGAMGGTFGWHPYAPKMLGDVVSNMYEELVHRGLLFAACYGAACGATFPLRGPVDRLGVVAGALGSSVTFAFGHTQYPVALRVVMCAMAIFVWAWPMARARSLWAPWIPHTLGDVIGDSILKL